MNNAPASWFLPIHLIAARRTLARAVLLTLAGWTSSKIAGGVWRARRYGSPVERSDFTAAGVAALKTSIAPGPPPVKS